MEKKKHCFASLASHRLAENRNNIQTCSSAVADSCVKTLKLNPSISFILFLFFKASPVGDSERLPVERRPRRVRKRSLTFLACSSSSRFFCRSSSESCSSGSGSFTRSITLPVLSEGKTARRQTQNVQNWTSTSCQILKRKGERTGTPPQVKTLAQFCYTDKSCKISVRLRQKHAHAKENVSAFSQ